MHVICITTYIISFWSSATEPYRDSWSKCQETSSTTAVWPVKMVFASTICPSFGAAPISHKQIVWRQIKGCTIALLKWLVISRKSLNTSGSLFILCTWSAKLQCFFNYRNLTTYNILCPSQEWIWQLVCKMSIYKTCKLITLRHMFQ